MGKEDHKKSHEELMATIRKMKKKEQEAKKINQAISKSQQESIQDAD